MERYRVIQCILYFVSDFCTIWKHVKSTISATLSLPSVTMYCVHLLNNFFWNITLRTSLMDFTLMKKCPRHSWVAIHFENISTVLSYCHHNDLFSFFLYKQLAKFVVIAIWKKLCSIFSREMLWYLPMPINYLLSLSKKNMLRKPASYKYNIMDKETKFYRISKIMVKPFYLFYF